MLKKYFTLVMTMFIILGVLPTKVFASDIVRYSFGDHEYAIIDQSMTWKEAKEYCENLGGHLATITSQKEQDFVFSILSRYKKNMYWLGGSDENKEGDWKWVTGEKWSYNNWPSHEPNGGANENYLMIYRIDDQSDSNTKASRWNDLYNTAYRDFHALDNIGFVCEWDDIQNVQEFYATKVVNFQPGNPMTKVKLNTIPENTLGIPDRTDDKDGDLTLTLGAGGVLILEMECFFTDGPGHDLIIYEAGDSKYDDKIELTYIEISSDLANWISVGKADGATSYIDINPYVVRGQNFKYVRITDGKSHSTGQWPGADIDAVGVLYNVSANNSSTNVNNTVKPVVDSTYYIESALSNNMVLDCEGASQETDAKILLCHKNDGTNQQIRIESVGGDYVKLIFAHSDKAAVVWVASYDEGAPIIQCPYNGTQNDEWKIVDAGNGYFYIQNRRSSKYLGVNGGKAIDTSSICQTSNQTIAQKWKFTPVGSVTSPSTPNTHTFFFDANGGSGAPASMVMIYGNPFKFPTQQPSRSGYDFLGWSEDKYATSASYAPNQTVSSFNDVEKRFYAIWRNASNSVDASPMNGYYRAINSNGTKVISVNDSMDIYEVITSLIRSKADGYVIDSSGKIVYRFTGKNTNKPSVFWKFQLDKSYGSTTSKDEAMAWVDPDNYLNTIVIGDGGQVFASGYRILNNYGNVGTSSSYILGSPSQSEKDKNTARFREQHIRENGYTEANAGAFVYQYIDYQPCKQITFRLNLTQARIGIGSKGDLSRCNGWIYVQPTSTGYNSNFGSSGGGDTGLQIYFEGNEPKIRASFSNCKPGDPKIENIIPLIKEADGWRGKFDVEISVGYRYNGKDGTAIGFMTIKNLTTNEIIGDYDGIVFTKQQFNDMKVSFILATSFIWDKQDVGDHIFITPDFANGSYMRNIIWQDVVLSNTNGYDYNTKNGCMPWQGYPFHHTYLQDAVGNLDYFQDGNKNTFGVSIDYNRSLHRQ